MASAEKFDHVRATGGPSRGSWESRGYFLALQNNRGGLAPGLGEMLTMRSDIQTLRSAQDSCLGKTSVALGVAWRSTLRVGKS